MKTAIIVGGGVAGLAAAKVLAPHFNQVTVYDKNEVKQSHHQHVLLQSGQRIIENIFPGIMETFTRAGCQQVDWANDTLWENSDGFFPRYLSSTKTISMSRILLQTSMFESLSKISNVNFLDERVEKISDLEASLIVIAGGQNFSLEKILGDILVSETKKTINLTYRSYVFNLEDLNMRGFKQYYFQIDPPRSYIGGVICPIENNKAMVTLIVQEERVQKCDTYEDFLRLSRLISGGHFYEIIKNAKPLTNIATFRKMVTCRRVLDENRVPEGVIVLGDVLNSLNPVFGQGMTLSLLQVEELNKMLLSNSFDEKKFSIKCNQLSFVPYLLSRTGSEDRGVAKFFLRQYLKLCQKSQFLHNHFLKILHSLGSPKRLM